MMSKMRKAVMAFTCACMMTALVSVPAFAAESTDAPFETGGTQYDTLQGALNAVPNGGTISLTGDATVTTGVTLSKSITFDLGNSTLSTSEEFSGNVFSTELPFTLTGDSNGAINMAGSPASKCAVWIEGRNAAFTMNGGTIKGNDQYKTYAVGVKEGTAELNAPSKIDGFTTNILTSVKGTTTINGGTYTNDMYANVDNVGTTEIHGGTFINTSCSSCSGDWGYTVRNRGISMTIDEASADVTVLGVQGALAATNGTTVIDAGHFETQSCEVHTGGATAFYALYAAGEVGFTDVEVNGGEFISCSRTAVMIGNSNDGGGKQDSICMINDGTFTTNGAPDVAVVTVDNANGEASQFISGGRFNRELTGTFLAAGCQQTPDGTGYYEVN